MKKLSLQVGTASHPKPFVNAQFTEDGWEVHYIGDVPNRTPRNSSALNDSTLLRLVRYFSWQNMLRLQSYWGIVHRSYHVTTASTGSFSKEDLPCTAGYRSASVRSACLDHESDLLQGLHKSPINLRLRCIRHLSRLLVSQKSSMWGSDQGQIKHPEPDELVDIQTHFDPKLPTVLFVGGSWQELSL